jgi:two-component system OmpR family sensor kinase
VIYLTSTFLLFSIASWVFYSASKHHLLDKQRESLKYEAGYIQSQLRVLHQSNAAILFYPESRGIDSAIYDLDKQYIFGTYKTERSLDHMNDTGKLYHIVHIEPYYLGAAYLLVSKPIDFKPIAILQKNIILFMFLAGIFFSILGYFLGKLFIEPMRNAMEQMNHFIQDTTHELNTPISTIVTNIEMIETFDKCEKNSPELKRIEIASKTLSRIYDDLTYLNLNHNYHREIVRIDMSELLYERLTYFTAMAEAKRLQIVSDIETNIILFIDKNDAIRLIDNLISNAIKYNRSYGKLYVGLTQESFVVQDSGIGIRSKDLSSISQRFKRANNSEGGFGIGLDIVNQVVNSYGFVLKINSKENEGTEVIVKWKN